MANDFSGFTGFQLEDKEEPRRRKSVSENALDGFTGLKKEKPLKQLPGVIKQPAAAVIEAGAGLAGLPGTVESVFAGAASLLEDYIPDAYAAKIEAMGGTPEQVEVARKVAEDNPYERALPTPDEILKFAEPKLRQLGDKVGVDLDIEPKTQGERMRRTGAIFAGQTPVFGGSALRAGIAGAGAQFGEEELGAGSGAIIGAIGGGRLAKGFFGKGLKTTLGGAAIGGATGAALGEFEPTRGLLGAVAAEGLIGAGKGVRNFFKGGTKAAGARAIGATARVKPNQIRQDLMGIAKRDGVTLPAPVKADNKVLNFLYTKALQSSLTGDALNNEIKATSEKLIGNITKGVREMPGAYRASAESLGSDIQGLSRDFLKNRKAQIGKIYQEGRDVAKTFDINGNELLTSLNELRSELGNTLAEGSNKKTVLGTVDQLINKIDTTKDTLLPLNKGLRSKLLTEARKAVGGEKELQKHIKKLEKALTGVPERVTKTGETDLLGKAVTKTDKAVPVKTENVKNVLQEIISDIKKSSFKSENAKKAVPRLEELAQDLTKKVPLKPDEVKLPASTAMNSIQDLNDIMGFETFGNVKKTLSKITGTLKKGLREGAVEEAPMFNRLLDRANNEYAELAGAFKSDKDIARLIDTPNPEQILKFASSPKKLDRLYKALPGEGTGELAQRSQNLKQDLEKTLLQKKIVDSMTNNKGDITLTRASNVFDKETSQLIRKLVGETEFKRIMRAKRLAKETSQSITRFMNASQSASTGIDFALISGMVGSALSFNPAAMAMGFGLPGGLKLFTEIMADPKMVDIMIETALANQIKDPKQFNKVMLPLMQQALKKLSELTAKSDVNIEDLGFIPDEPSE